MSNEVASEKKQTKFPKVFWSANFIDIVQYIAWYAFYGNISLYVTNSAHNGGLGLSNIDRAGFTGVLFFLGYITPTIAGALSDRYGYKKLYYTAFLIMIPAYFLAAYVKTYWGFFAACVLLGIGLGCFRPLAVGVISTVTNSSNRSVGFGINYALFNIGATIGTIMAVQMKAISWDAVFISAACVLLLNFVLLSGMDEPSDEAKSDSKNKRSLKQVLTDTQEVLGNGRLALMVIPILVATLMAGKAMSWSHFLVFALLWSVGLNIVWAALNSSGKQNLIALAIPLLMALIVIITSQLQWTEESFIPSFVSNNNTWMVFAAIAILWFTLRISKLNLSAKLSHSLILTILPIVVLEVAVQMEFIARGMMFVLLGAWLFLLLMHLLFTSTKQSSHSQVWYQEKPKIGNWPFVVYLLIMAGFWAIYKQIFITMPLYVQNFVDTNSALNFLGFDWLTQVDVSKLSQEITTWLAQYSAGIPEAELTGILLGLKESGLKISQEEFLASFQLMQTGGGELVTQTAISWKEKYAQIDPTWLFNINFISIVCFQVLVSKISANFDPVKVLITGCMIIALAFGITGFAHHLTWAFAFMVLVTLTFSFGEMIASPKSYEYVATFAPKGKVGMFMGYSFVSYAIGGIFGTLLSVWSYELFAIERNSPEMLWITISSVGVLTCLALFIFNKTVVHHIKAQQKAVSDQQKADEDLDDDEDELIPA